MDNPTPCDKCFPLGCRDQTITLIDALTGNAVLMYPCTCACHGTPPIPDVFKA